MAETPLTIVELLDFYTETEVARKRILSEVKPALDQITADQKDAREAIEDLARDLYESQGAKTFKASGHEVRLSEKAHYYLDDMGALEDFLESKGDKVSRFERTTLDIDAIRKAHGDSVPGLSRTVTTGFGIWEVKSK